MVRLIEFVMTVIAGVLVYLIANGIIAEVNRVARGERGKGDSQPRPRLIWRRKGQIDKEDRR